MNRKVIWILAVSLALGGVAACTSLTAPKFPEEGEDEPPDNEKSGSEAYVTFDGEPILV